VRTSAKAPDETQDVFVKHSKSSQLPLPPLQFCLVGKATFKNEKGNFQEGPRFREFSDRVPAVAQNTALTVDKRDRAIARSRISESRIVDAQPSPRVFHPDPGNG
jgi:hypothetical protein